MTEEEWLVCTQPLRMLKYLGDRASGRKLRLIGCGCCRRVWHLLTDTRARLAVECAERYADGIATDEERRHARHEAHVARGLAPNHSRLQQAIKVAYEVANPSPFDAAHSGGYIVAYVERERTADEQEELTQHTRVIRDIFGNPFHPVTILPEWLTSTVLALATGIYEEKAFDRMPILADALMDAGCSNEDILNHCRGPGPHVRGCFVVDLILGKE
jgi:hypothetical protein